MWTDEYIGLPFLHDGRERDGLDCWGLVRMVYRKELDIELPPYKGIYRDNSRETILEIGTVMARESRRWQEVTEPEQYDVVLLRIAGRLPTHVGVVAGKRYFLHIMEGIQSVVEPLNSPLWVKRIAGFYRCG